jgi:hypothetical protein
MPYSTYTCAFCGSDNEAEVDTSASKLQRYVEDCQTCCRPNLLTIQIDNDGEPTVTAEPENG